MSLDFPIWISSYSSAVCKVFYLYASSLIPRFSLSNLDHLSSSCLRYFNAWVSCRGICSSICSILNGNSLLIRPHLYAESYPAPLTSHSQEFMDRWSSDTWNFSLMISWNLVVRVVSPSSSTEWMLDKVSLDIFWQVLSRKALNFYIYDPIISLNWSIVTSCSKSTSSATSSMVKRVSLSELSAFLAFSTASKTYRRFFIVPIKFLIP